MRNIFLIVIIIIIVIVFVFVIVIVIIITSQSSSFMLTSPALNGSVVPQEMQTAHPLQCHLPVGIWTEMTENNTEIWQMIL
jgi:hypothetical protein